MSKHLLLTKYDISQSNHERWPHIMARFVESFSEPVIIGGDFAGPGAGTDGRPTVGHIVSVEQRGDDLWGEVNWITPPPTPRGGKYIRMSWSFGPGPDRVSLSSGFLEHWPHRTSWEDEDEGPELDDGPRMWEPDEDEEHDDALDYSGYGSGDWIK